MSALPKVKPRPAEPAHRRTNDKVRRGSKPRDPNRVFLRLEVRVAGDQVWALRRWNRRQERARGKKNRGVGHVAIELYEWICFHMTKVGSRLDNLSIKFLASELGHAASAVVDALARLKAHGWIEWTREWVPTGNAGQRGPQVEQTFNFYRLLTPFAALLKLGIRFGRAPTPDDHDLAAKAAEASREAWAKQDGLAAGAAASPAIAAADAKAARELAAQSAAERESAGRSDSSSS